MVENVCDPNTWEAETRGSSQVRGQPELHSKTLVSKKQKEKPKQILSGCVGLSTQGGTLLD